MDVIQHSPILFISSLGCHVTLPYTDHFVTWMSCNTPLCNSFRLLDVIKHSPIQFISSLGCHVMQHSPIQFISSLGCHVMQHSPIQLISSLGCHVMQHSPIQFIPSLACVATLSCTDHFVTWMSCHATLSYTVHSVTCLCCNAPLYSSFRQLLVLQRPPIQVIQCLACHAMPLTSGQHCSVPDLCPTETVSRGDFSSFDTCVGCLPTGNVNPPLIIATNVTAEMKVF